MPCAEGMCVVAYLYTSWCMAQVASQTARADGADGEVLALQRSLSECGGQITALQDLLRSSSDHSEPVTEALVTDLQHLDAQLIALRTHSQKGGSDSLQAADTASEPLHSHMQQPASASSLHWQKRTDTAKRSEQGGQRAQQLAAQVSKQLAAVMQERDALQAANAELRAHCKGAGRLIRHDEPSYSDGHAITLSRQSWKISASPADPGLAAADGPVGSDQHDLQAESLAAMETSLAAEQQMRAELEITSGHELGTLRQQVLHPALAGILALSSSCMSPQHACTFAT